MEIVKFTPRPEAEPDPELVERIEELLERAKAGEIQGLMYCGVAGGPDNEVLYGWAGGKNNDLLMSSALMQVTVLWQAAILPGITNSITEED